MTFEFVFSDFFSAFLKHRKKTYFVKKTTEKLKIKLHLTLRIHTNYFNISNEPSKVDENQKVYVFIVLIDYSKKLLLKFTDRQVTYLHAMLLVINIKSKKET